LIQREKDVQALFGSLDKRLAEARQEINIWAEDTRKEAGGLLAQDEEAWNRLSKGLPDLSGEANKVAIAKLKSKETIDIRRQQLSKIEARSLKAVSRIELASQDSVKAMEQSKKELKSSLNGIDINRIKDESRQEGHKIALKKFITTYNEADKSTESKEMAAAVKTVSIVEETHKIRKAMEAKFDQKLALSRVPIMEAGQKKGIVMGNIGIIRKIVCHAESEPSPYLEDGTTRNPDHVATIGYQCGKDILEHKDLLGKVAPPKNRKDGADYGFYDAMAKGLEAALAEVTAKAKAEEAKEAAKEAAEKAKEEKEAKKKTKSSG
jgi:hypothetical protein